MTQDRCEKTPKDELLSTGFRGKLPVMSIREAIPADAALLAEIIGNSFRDVAIRFGLSSSNCPTHPSNCTSDWIESDLAKGKHYFLLEQDGQGYGCVALERAEPDVCYLDRLTVLPAFRRRRFGEFLVRHVLDEARRLGARRVEIGIIAEHHELRAWYERLGFVERETKRFAHLPFTVLFMYRPVDQDQDMSDDGLSR